MTTLHTLVPWLATGMSFLTLTLTILWATSANKEESYLGGLDWDDRVFNWHPVLMVAGMLVGLTNGVLSFRRPLERTTNKAMHAFWFIAAIVTMSIGLKAVWKSHDDKKPYKANLYTLHSMIGLAAVVLVSQNFVLGMLNFVSPLMSDMVKKVYKPNHIFLGVCALVMAVMAIVTGVQEKNGFSSCGYTVDERDTNPAANYHMLPDGCKMSNGVGICAFITLLLTLYSLANVGKERDTQNDPMMTGLMDDDKRV